MAFDFGSFFAGASEGAATAITNRNKEIRNGALKQFDRLVEEATAKEKGILLERDVYKAQSRIFANARGMDNSRLTPNQILGLIQQPEYAKSLIKRLESTEDLSQIDLSTVFKLDEKNKGTEMSPEAYGVKKTSIPTGQTIGQPTQVVRGAFGLESPAYGQAEEEFARNYGKSISEVRAIARGKPEMDPDFKPMKGTLDLSQFAKPEAYVDIQGKLRDKVASGIPISDPRNERQLKQLQAHAIIKDTFEGKDGANKPRTAGEIRNIMKDSLTVAVDPWIIKGMVKIDPETNDMIIIGGGADEIAAFQKQKTETIKAQAKAIGILDDKGNILGGQGSRDYLVAHANLEGDKIISWKADEVNKKKNPPPPDSVNGIKAPIIPPSPTLSPAANQSVVMLPQGQKKPANIPRPAGIDPKLWGAMTEDQKALWK